MAAMLGQERGHYLRIGFWGAVREKELERQSSGDVENMYDTRGRQMALSIARSLHRKQTKMRA